MSDSRLDRVKAAIAGAQDAGYRQGDHLIVYDGTMDLDAMARAAIEAMRPPGSRMIVFDGRSNRAVELDYALIAWLQDSAA